jgi:hypothetical protein
MCPGFRKRRKEFQDRGRRRVPVPSFRLHGDIFANLPPDDRMI